MSKELLMQFVGFSSKETVREYVFTVREPATEPREFTLTIANEAFTKHRISFQDAPGVCSLKLRRELATSGNQSSRHAFSHYRPGTRGLSQQPFSQAQKPVCTQARGRLLEKTLESMS